MFYSHDILTNSQHGVATIWLVATVCKNSQKRLNRKVIQDVDVPRACEKIIHPDAPLALRLQGSLLYGVSRVFAQQCGYVLADAERCQSDMLSYFKGMHQSELDPQAGKTKRHLITLQDDPTFDPMAVLPQLDALDWDMDAVLQSQSSSMNRYSQFTPLASHHSSALGRSHSNVSIDLPGSSQGSFGLPDFGQTPTPYKPVQIPGAEVSNLDPFGDDDEHLGVALEIDADGNLIGIFGEEPELPPLPSTSNAPANPAHAITGQVGQSLENHASGFTLKEAPLTDAQPFPITHTANQQAAPQSSSTISSEGEQAVVPRRRGRHSKAKANMLLDEKTSLSRLELRESMNNYLDNMNTQRKRRKTRSIALARRNAAASIFGNGIASIGIPLDRDAQIFSPLAIQFSGERLRASLLGKANESDKLGASTRRRGRTTAFGDELDEHEDSRGTKAARRNEPEIERYLHNTEGNQLLPDDTDPEVGMDGAKAMGDHHSSTMMPWSRAGSAIPGSSVRGSAKKPSPLPSHMGSAIRSIERHSDIGDHDIMDLGDHFASGNS